MENGRISMLSAPHSAPAWRLPLTVPESRRGWHGRVEPVYCCLLDLLQRLPPRPSHVSRSFLLETIWGFGAVEAPKLGPWKEGRKGAGVGFGDEISMPAPGSLAVSGKEEWCPGPLLYARRSQLSVWEPPRRSLLSFFLFCFFGGEGCLHRQEASTRR